MEVKLISNIVLGNVEQVMNINEKGIIGVLHTTPSINKF